MYYFITSLFHPFTFCYLLLTFAIIHIWRSRVLSRRQLLFLGLPYLALTLLFMPPVSFLTIGTLEWQNPPRPERPAETRAIVVLSGGAFRPNATRPKAHLSSDSLIRCLHTAELYHQDAPCLVIATGGKVHTDDLGPSLSQLMFEFLVKLGVSEKDLVIEDRSRSTYENAAFTAEILQERGIDEILLVTDSIHLPRAMLCFEKLGIRAVPSGAVYVATEFKWTPRSFLPSLSGARGIGKVSHEWLGMLYYRLLGRI